MPTFCRHNRLEATCPICSRKPQPGYKPVRPPRRPATRQVATGGSSTRRRSARSASDLRVRRVSRAPDDGYDQELVPGLRATIEATRLADEIAFAVARLDVLDADPPGLYAQVAAPGDVEERAWLAFLIAYLSPLEDDEPFAAIEAVRVPWSTGELPDLEGVATGSRTAHDPSSGTATLSAYRAWVARAGSQAAAFHGEDAWPPQRRFERAFERLALPRFGRAARYELLVLLGHLGVFDLRPWSLHLSEPLDPTTVAAKRVFGIGDTLNLQRRAAELAGAAGVPIEALDLALVNWAHEPQEPAPDPDGERVTGGVRAVADPARAAALRTLLVAG